MIRRAVELGAVARLLAAVDRKTPLLVAHVLDSGVVPASAAEVMVHRRPIEPVDRGAPPDPELAARLLDRAVVPPVASFLDRGSTPPQAHRRVHPPREPFVLAAKTCVVGDRQCELEGEEPGDEGVLQRSPARPRRWGFRRLLDGLKLARGAGKVTVLNHRNPASDNFWRSGLRAIMRATA